MVNALGGTNLTSIEACETLLSKFFDKNDKGFYEKGIMKLNSRWFYEKGIMKLNSRWQQVIKKNGGFFP
uniref:Putative LOC101460606 [Ceratitis capitata] n=1 Tax=Lepeophtheirus salmonis TaxID=72036 RepID=A0A0K2URQ4_LEPSM